MNTDKLTMLMTGSGQVRIRSGGPPGLAISAMSNCVMISTYGQPGLPSDAQVAFGPVQL